MRHVLWMPAVAAMAVLAVAGGGRADDKKAAFSDAEFVSKAGSGGMLEVELGKLAVAHGQADGVKKFGQKMIDDHTKANAGLKAAAAEAGLAPPAKLLPDHQKHYDMLKGLSGAEFDKAYLTHMTKDHEEDVELFTQASQEAKHPALKAAAAKTLPVVKEHLAMLKKMHHDK